MAQKQKYKSNPIQTFKRYEGEPLDKAIWRLKRTISWVFSNVPRETIQGQIAFEKKSEELVCPAVWQLVEQTRQAKRAYLLQPNFAKFDHPFNHPFNLADELIRQENSYLKTIFEPRLKELKQLFKKNSSKTECDWRCFDNLALQAKRHFDHQFHLKGRFNVKSFYENFMINHRTSAARKETDWSKHHWSKKDHMNSTPIRLDNDLCKIAPKTTHLRQIISLPRKENDQFKLEAIIEPDTIVNSVFSDEILDLPEPPLENPGIIQEINPIGNEVNPNQTNVNDQINDNWTLLKWIYFTLQCFCNSTMVRLLLGILSYIGNSRSHSTALIFIGILTIATLIQTSKAETLSINANPNPKMDMNFSKFLVSILVASIIFDIFHLVNSKTWNGVTRHCRKANNLRTNLTIPSLKPNNFQLIITLICFTSTTASPLTSMNNDILFHHKGETLLNPTTIKSVKSYRPCDALIFDNLLDKNVKFHADACNVKIMDDFDSTIVRNSTKNFILLEKKLPLTMARRTCRDLGTSIVTVKNEKGARLLYHFMSSHNIHRTFAGITNDNDILEPIFDDDSSLAANIYFSKLFDENEKKNRSWNEVLQKLDKPHPYYHRHSYYEFRRGANLELNVWWESNNEYEWKKFGLSRELWTICLRPKTSTDTQMAINAWNYDCSKRQEYLKTASTLIHRKVQEILPSNIPPSNPKKLDNTIFFTNEMYGLNPSNNNHQNLGYENNENFQKILKEDAIPLTQQCNQLLSKYKTGDLTDQIERNKRGLALTALSVAFSLFAFALEKGLASQIFSRNNKHQEFSDPVIPWMIENSNFDRHYESAIKFTSATTNEQKIYATCEKIITYINKLHEHLTEILYSHNYVAKANDYFSNSDYDLFAKEVKAKYGVSIPNNKKKLKTQVIISDNSYMVAFIIPIEVEKFHHDLYELIPLGKFNNDNKFYPKLSAKFIAVSTTGTQTYTILDNEEMTRCDMEPFCVVKNPSHAALSSTCGICSFYGKSQCCDFVQAQNNKPDFKTIENTTYYSINNEQTINLDISCFSTRTRGVGSNNRIQIKGSGHFGLDLGCKATWQDITIRSAETEIFEPLTSDAKLFTDYPNDKIGMLDNIRFDMKTLASKKLTEKYLIPILVMVGILAAFMFIIFPATYIIIKYYAGRKILGCLTRYPERELAKLDRHITKKSEREQKKAMKEGQNPQEVAIEMDITPAVPSMPSSRDKRSKVSMTRQGIDSTKKTERQISLSNHMDNPEESNLTNLTREQIFKALHSLKPKD
jgi:hypothetical protein